MTDEQSDAETIDGGGESTREERTAPLMLSKEERLRARALKQHEFALARQLRLERASYDQAAQLLRRQSRPGPEETPQSIESTRQEIAAGRFSSPGDVIERLKAFPDAQVLHVKRLMGRVGIGPWPPIDGCLAILFISRAGSTYLARDLECAYSIGRLRETLNLHRGKNETPREIVKPGADAWFSFKAGVPGVICGELGGFFDAYLDKTSFILLLRRDIVAQAISNVKSVQTGQWHSNQSPARPASYDRAEIARYVRIIAEGVEKLRLYAAGSGRPWRVLVYEDFADGDFTSAHAVCDALGVPRREADSHVRAMPVERIGDATNVAWGARFREEMDGSLRDSVERYLRLF